MDLLHFVLISVIIFNNIPFFRKYYYPLFFSYSKKLIRLVKKYWNSIYYKFINLRTKQEFKSEDRKISDFYQNSDDLKKIQRSLSWKYQIAVMNLNSNLNIGAIYRTGCLLGMEKYIILGKKIYNPKSQVGLDFVQIEYLDTFKNLRDRNNSETVENFNIKLFLNYVNNNNLVPILIEQGGSNLLDINFEKLSNKLNNEQKFIFIFGNETHGISKNLISLAREKNWLIISIPQWGCAHSYNVSQAANIIMWKFYQDNIIKLRENLITSY